MSMAGFWPVSSGHLGWYRAGWPIPKSWLVPVTQTPVSSGLLWKGRLPGRSLVFLI